MDLLNTQEVTAAQPVGETDDWGSFYVNIFVDRDMFMRHAGGGAGHAGSTADIDRFSNEMLDDEGDGDGNNLHAGSSLDNNGDNSDESEDDHDHANNVELNSGDELGPDDGEDLYEDDGYASP
ncbi:hypothetical protein J3R30DRAFT_3444139 [Lentinula aciculospora]|uniref:Uncharacterized protein n=1 Tax=Lentinula aciculospora TaxID=153920 RepID=A0A9W9ANP3_9AGAR|nr:hypothetical protein J3R30DRAFT_3444139 [Lentinula aciculospora]